MTGKHGVAVAVVLVLATSLGGEATFGRRWPHFRRGRTHRDRVNDFLAPHNAARARVGLPGLAWDEGVAAYARRYAEQRRGDCALVHSDTDAAGLGENIFQGDGYNWSPEDAVGDWIGERRYYNYRANACAFGRDCEHYTQVVWRSTTSVGCARVRCDGGGIFVTCNYSPPGNYLGQRPY